MADENEHVKNLEKALGSLIDRRRQIAIGLSEPFKRGRTENLQERFNVVQTTIEALRKAIDEEKHIAETGKPFVPTPPRVA